MVNPPQKRKRRILVVDDEIAICRTIQKILVREGHEVLIASQGEKALKKLKENLVDLMIVDFKMPVMDGLEVVRQARTIQKNLKAIFLTAYGTAASAREALLLGVTDFITKPFDNRLLKKVVQEALHAKR